MLPNKVIIETLGSPDIPHHISLPSVAMKVTPQENVDWGIGSMAAPRQRSQRPMGREQSPVPI